MVGDSFAMGWGVEDDQSMCRVVERELRQRILNYGVSGYGPQQALIALERHALRYSPKVVLWLYYPNDADDSLYFEAWRDRPARTPGDSPSPKRASWSTATQPPISFYRFMGKARSTDRFTYKKDGLDYLFAPYWKPNINPEHPRTKNGAPLVYREIDKFARLAKKHGFRPIFIAMPYREQCYAEEFASVDPERNQPPANPSVYDQTVAYSKKAGISTLDLLATMRANKTRQIYFRDDPHLTADGNEVAGRQVAKFLKGLDLPR